MEKSAKKVSLVVGARPNFIKAAPLLDELKKRRGYFDPLLIHTGQHYDHRLSQLFFDQLKMPKPDFYLGVGSASHARQTAEIMVALENNFGATRPDLVIVFGDVNSTIAAAIVAAKQGVKLAHVEAGLRSFDNSMPEEINRVVTDRLSDILFVTEQSGIDNLRREGVTPDKINFAGNIMIDSLVSNLKISQESRILDELGLAPKEYSVLTLHRPSNVDNPGKLASLFETLQTIGRRIPVIFPCHPRTLKEAGSAGLIDKFGSSGFRFIEPLGYIDFLRLQSQSKMVLTDSGGIQEETTFLQVPCITIRENTERPVTVDVGSNVLTGTDPEKILDAVESIMENRFKSGGIPELWDGSTAVRIADYLTSA